MLKKYFFQILSFVVLNVFLVLFVVQEKNYESRAREVAVQFKKNFLKDSVTNFINEFTRERTEAVDFFDMAVSERENVLRDHLHGARSEKSAEQALETTFTSQDQREMWGYALVRDSDEEMIFSQNMDSNWDYSQKMLDDIFCVWREIDLDFAKLYFGVTQEHLYNTVLAEVRSKIHNSHFVEETYYWINEVKNYKGGKDFAVRLVHPNPRSSEGMLLSTDMQDAVGDLPYARELDEINKNGECFNTYYFKKKDSDNFARKITYSKLYKPYNWIVCMGSYYDDIYDYVDTINRSGAKTLNMLAILAIILLDVALAAYLAARLYGERKGKSALRAQENRDQLTEANTKEFGEKEIKEKFSAFKENDESPAVMFMDIDNFKTINDAHGREAGDFVLVQVAQAFYKQSRSSDILIRWENDKFAGIFGGMKRSDCWRYSQKLLDAISSRKIQYKDKTIQVTVSLGFSFFSQEDKSPAQALERAERALKESKAAGKNRARVE